MASQAYSQASDDGRTPAQGAARRRGGRSALPTPVQQALTLGPGALVTVGVLVGIALLLMSTLGLVAVVVVLVGATLVIAGLDMRESQATEA